MSSALIDFATQEIRISQGFTSWKPLYSSSVCPFILINTCGGFKDSSEYFSACKGKYESCAVYKKIMENEIKPKNMKNENN